MSRPGDRAAETAGTRDWYEDPHRARSGRSTAASRRRPPGPAVVRRTANERPRPERDRGRRCRHPALFGPRGRVSNTPGRRALPTTKTTTTHAHDDDGLGRPPTVPKRYASPPDANLSVVSCAAPSACVMGSSTGQTYRLYLERSWRSAPPCRRPAPGHGILACAGSGFCVVAPEPEPGARSSSGSAWQAPPPFRPRRASWAIDWTGRRFRDHHRRREGNWSPSTARLVRQSRRLGSGQPDLVGVPELLYRRRGRALGLQRADLSPARRHRQRGPARPRPAPRRRSASSSTATGRRPDLERPRLSARRPSLRAAPQRHQRLGPDLRLLPDDDVLPRRGLPRRVFGWNAPDLERRTLIDSQGHVTDEHLVPRRFPTASPSTVGQRVIST